MRIEPEQYINKLRVSRNSPFPRPLPKTSALVLALVVLLFSVSALAKQPAQLSIDFDDNDANTAVGTPVTATDASDFETAQAHTTTAPNRAVSDPRFPITVATALPQLQITYIAVVAESATTGTTIAEVTLAQVADSDAASSATWSLSDPNEPDLFAISSASGVITLIAGGTLDYETLTQHIVMVRAEADGEELITVPLTIRVTNVLEALMIDDSDATTNTVAENAAAGTTVTGIALTVRDEGDRAVGGVTWNVAGAPADLFTVDADGAIRLATSGALDYEASTAHAVIVRATKDAVVSNDLGLTIEVTNDPTDDDGTEPSEPALRIRLRLFLEGPLR